MADPTSFRIGSRVVKTVRRIARGLPVVVFVFGLFAAALGPLVLIPSPWELVYAGVAIAVCLAYTVGEAG